MRIISGIHKGKKINPPKNLPVRPTTDFAKEGLFNILNNIIDFEKTIVLDLFAGTGSISFEFASRKAKYIVSVDLNDRCCDFILKTSKALNLNNLKVVKKDVFKFLTVQTQTYDLIFADPPYFMNDIELLPELIINKKLLNSGGYFILEHSSNIFFQKHSFFHEHRKYGNVNFTFFKEKNHHIGGF